jgi:hypothetical protein
VDVDGSVHAAGLGTANITATTQGRNSVSQVHVLPVVASVTLTSPVTEVLALDTVQLVAVARNYSNAVMTRKLGSRRRIRP